MDLSPIVHEYELPCTAEHAFSVFTGRIGEWWPENPSLDAETFDTVRIEPAVGGHVTTRHIDGREYRWGTVLAWDPGRRYAATFTLALDPAHPTVLNAEFYRQPYGWCHVVIEHGGWTEKNVADRSAFDEWREILDRFADLAGRGRTVSHIQPGVPAP